MVLIREGLAMPVIAFSSSDPLDQACRVLDVMRKMGFRLLALLSVDPQVPGAFRVRIAFEPAKTMSANTLVERIASCIGVHDLTHDPVLRAPVSTPAP